MFLEMLRFFVALSLGCFMLGLAAGLAVVIMIRVVGKVFDR